MSKRKKKKAAKPEVPETGGDLDVTCVEDGSVPESEANVAVAEPTVQELSEEIERLQTEKADQFDQFIRLKAEFENYKKRVRREIEQRVKYAEEEFVRRLLSALDSFGRALSQPAPNDDISSVMDGFERIRQQFHDAFDASGVTTVDSVGSKFDPYFHEAVLAVESDEHDEDSVVHELERGYTLRGKVIRAAKVAVNISRKTGNDEGSGEDSSSGEPETNEDQQDESPEE